MPRVSSTIRLYPTDRRLGELTFLDQESTDPIGVEDKVTTVRLGVTDDGEECRELSSLLQREDVRWQVSGADRSVLLLLLLRHRCRVERGRGEESSWRREIDRFAGSGRARSTAQTRPRLVSIVDRYCPLRYGPTSRSEREPLGLSSDTAERTGKSDLKGEKDLNSEYQQQNSRGVGRGVQGATQGWLRA